MIRARAIGLIAAWLIAPNLAIANIDVVLEGVDGDVALNIQTMLTLYRYRNEELDDLALQRLVGRAPGEVDKALRPFGYYHAETTVEVSEGGEATIRVRVMINPGPRSVWRTTNIELSGDGKNDAGLLRALATINLAGGQAIDHRDYDGGKATLEATAISRGFLDWRWLTHRLEIHPLVNKADAFLSMETGTRYKFGEIDLQQDAIDPDVARRFMRFRTGDDFNEQALLNTQYALLDSQYYRVVRVTPGNKDPLTKTVPIAIEAAAQTRQRITFGIGYGSDTRLRASTAWRWRRLNGRGHRAQARFAGASTRNELGLRYEIPGRDPVSEQLNIYSSFIDEELATTDSKRLTFGVSRTKRLGSWQLQTFADLIREETSLPGEAPSIDTLLVPGLSVDRWIRDRTINPRRGYRTTAQLRGSQQSLLSDTDFLRFEGSARWLASFREHYQLLARAEFGTAWVETFGALPASQRFFAGGDQSVRGFGFNELSPRDAQGAIIGGQHLVFMSLELDRAIRGPWRVAIFADGGGALRNLNDPLEYSLGIGLRWETPIGKLRIDLAKPVSIGGFSPRFHISIQPTL